MRGGTGAGSGSGARASGSPGGRTKSPASKATKLTAAQRMAMLSGKLSEEKAIEALEGLVLPGTGRLRSKATDSRSLPLATGGVRRSVSNSAVALPSSDEDIVTVEVKTAPLAPTAADSPSEEEDAAPPPAAESSSSDDAAPPPVERRTLSTASAAAPSSHRRAESSAQRQARMLGVDLPTPALTSAPSAAQLRAQVAALTSARSPTASPSKSAKPSRPSRSPSASPERAAAAASPGPPTHSRTESAVQRQTRLLLASGGVGESSGAASSASSAADELRASLTANMHAALAANEATDPREATAQADELVHVEIIGEEGTESSSDEEEAEGGGGGAAATILAAAPAARVRSTSVAAASAASAARRSSVSALPSAAAAAAAGPGRGSASQRAAMPFPVRSNLKPTPSMRFDPPSHRTPRNSMSHVDAPPGAFGSAARATARRASTLLSSAFDASPARVAAPAAGGSSDGASPGLPPGPPPGPPTHARAPSSAARQARMLGAQSPSKAPAARASTFRSATSPARSAGVRAAAAGRGPRKPRVVPKAAKRLRASPSGAAVAARGSPPAAATGEAPTAAQLRAQVAELAAARVVSPAVRSAARRSSVRQRAESASASASTEGAGADGRFGAPNLAAAAPRCAEPSAEPSAERQSLGADGGIETGGSDSGGDTFTDALAAERAGTPRTRFNTFVRRTVTADEAESSDDFDDDDEASRDRRGGARFGRRSKSHGEFLADAKRRASAKGVVARASASVATSAPRKTSLSLPPSASQRETMLAAMHAALKANAGGGDAGMAPPALPARPSHAGDRQLQAAWANEVGEITMELEAETAKSGKTPDLLRGWLYKPDFGREEFASTPEVAAGGKYGVSAAPRASTYAALAVKKKKKGLKGMLKKKKKEHKADGEESEDEAPKPLPRGPEELSALISHRRVQRRYFAVTQDWGELSYFSAEKCGAKAYCGAIDLTTLVDVVGVVLSTEGGGHTIAPKLGEMHALARALRRGQPCYLVTLYTSKYCQPHPQCYCLVTPDRAEASMWLATLRAAVQRHKQREEATQHKIRMKAQISLRPGGSGGGGGASAMYAGLGAVAEEEAAGSPVDALSPRAERGGAQGVGAAPVLRVRPSGARAAPRAKPVRRRIKSAASELWHASESQTMLEGIGGSADGTAASAGAMAATASPSRARPPSVRIQTSATGEDRVELPLNITVGTWNLGAEVPTHDELMRFCATGTTHDEVGSSGEHGESASSEGAAAPPLPEVWLLSFQEVVELKAYNIMMKNNRASIAACEALEGSVRTALDALLADEWEAKRVAAEAEEAAEGRRGGRRVVVPDGVVLLAMDRLVGLVSFVFARRSTALGARVEEVRSDSVGLDLWPGIWGIQSCVIPLGKKGLGNKGAIAIRLMVHGTSVCYINTHLAAKRAKFLARNENYHTVLKKVIFDTGGSTQHSTTAPQSVRQRLHITNIERRRVVHAYRRDSLEYDYSDVHGPNLLARKEKPPALPARIMDSDVCFWSGDLNYRLEPLCPTTRDAIDALGRATARAEAVSDDGGLAKLKARLAARADAAQAVVEAHESTGDHRRASSVMLQLGVAFEDATFEDGAKGVGEGGAGGDAAGSARRSLAAQREAEFKAVLERQKKYADDKKTNLDGPDLVGPAEESDHIFRCIDRGVRAPDGCPVLLLRDQLLCERRRGRVFRNWDEVKIAFPPTYKYLSRADPPRYDKGEGGKVRLPAWCDRILFRSRGELTPSLYTSPDKGTFCSDHRPVLAIFELLARPSERERAMLNRRKRERAELETTQKTHQSSKMLRLLGEK